MALALDLAEFVNIPDVIVKGFRVVLERLRRSEEELASMRTRIADCEGVAHATAADVKTSVREQRLAELLGSLRAETRESVGRVEDSMRAAARSRETWETEHSRTQSRREEAIAKVVMERFNDQLRAADGKVEAVASSLRAQFALIDDKVEKAVSDVRGTDAKLSTALQHYGQRSQAMLESTRSTVRALETKLEDANANVGHVAEQHAARAIEIARHLVAEQEARVDEALASVSQRVVQSQQDADARMTKGESRADALARTADALGAELSRLASVADNKSLLETIGRMQDVQAQLTDGLAAVTSGHDETTARLSRAETRIAEQISALSGELGHSNRVRSDAVHELTAALRQLERDLQQSNDSCTGALVRLQQQLDTTARDASSRITSIEMQFLTQIQVVQDKLQLYADSPAAVVTEAYVFSLETRIKELEQNVMSAQRAAESVVGHSDSVAQDTQRRIAALASRIKRIESAMDQRARSPSPTGDGGQATDRGRQSMLALQTHRIPAPTPLSASGASALATSRGPVSARHASGGAVLPPYTDAARRLQNAASAPSLDLSSLRLAPMSESVAASASAAQPLPAPHQPQLTQFGGAGSTSARPESAPSSRRRVNIAPPGQRT